MKIDTLTKLLALIFVFCVLMAALSIVVYDVLSSIPVNPVASAILSAGIGYAMHLLNIQIPTTTTT